MKRLAKSFGARLARLGLILALTPAVMLAACETAPATGRSIFTAGLSPAEEARMGRREHDKVVGEFGGVYDDPELDAYVTGLGRLIARTSEMPGLDTTFTILDSPIVNAFALPGGYVYITRGLLALAETEAELAGVLAHEIGHITARHTAERYGQSVAATAASIGFGLLFGESAAGLANDALGLAVLGYSREQEYEADLLGVRYLSRSGHDTRAMAGFLEKMLAHSRLEARLRGRPGRADATDITQTHPRTADRIQRAIRQAGVRPVADPIVARDLYLRKIDGLLYGDSPRQGYARGRRFSHPGLGFTFEVPAGFRLSNGPRAVRARDRRGAVIVFDRAQRPSRKPMTRYIAEDWARGIELPDLEAITVNGMEAATGSTRRATRQGASDWRLVAIRFDRDSIYRFIFQTPAEATAELNGPLRRATYSFRRLGRSEASNLAPYRLRTHRVRGGDTPRRLASRMPFEENALDRFLVLNGLNAGDVLRRGETVKIVTQ